MNNQNPATPAAPVAPATPGSDPNVITPPSTPTPAVVPEGKVTISTKEFAQLSRDAARGRSAQKRNDLKNNRGSAPTVPDGDPDIVKTIQEANDRADQAEREKLKLEVKGKVRDLLDKEEFKVLPKSTRELILKNPALLSEADNLEEAMLDIEDFVRESVLTLNENGGGKVEINMPPARETPPAAGNPPAPTPAVAPIDVTNLKGPARSQALIRNALKFGKKT